MLFKPGEAIVRPPCDHCGGKTLLCRREPHPKWGLPAELRTFECSECGKLTYREDAPGGGWDGGPAPVLSSA
jgi:hypothetical protein